MNENEVLPQWAHEAAKLADFHSRYIHGGADECWLWRGEAGEYGSFYWPSHGTGQAHRIAFQLAHGRRIKPGMVIDHRCNRKKCQNPRHMAEVTREENLRRIGERREACAAGHSRVERGYQDARGRRRCEQCDIDRRSPDYKPRRSWTFPKPDLGFAVATEESAT